MEEKKNTNSQSDSKIKKKLCFNSQSFFLPEKSFQSENNYNSLNFKDVSQKKKKSKKKKKKKPEEEEINDANLGEWAFPIGFKKKEKEHNIIKDNKKIKENKEKEVILEKKKKKDPYEKYDLINIPKEIAKYKTTHNIVHEKKKVKYKAVRKKKKNYIFFY